MKKIIASLVLGLGFVVSANAQTENTEVVAVSKSKTEALELQKLLGLSDDLTLSLTQLFNMKAEVLDNPAVAEDKKTEMARMVGLKIQASLTPEQHQKLMKNQEVYLRLSGIKKLEQKK